MVVKNHFDERHRHETQFSKIKSDAITIATCKLKHNMCRRYTIKVHLRIQLFAGFSESVGLHVKSYDYHYHLSIAAFFSSNNKLKYKSPS